MWQKRVRFACRISISHPLPSNSCFFPLFLLVASNMIPASIDRQLLNEFQVKCSVFETNAHCTCWTMKQCKISNVFSVSVFLPLCLCWNKTTIVACNVHTRIMMELDFRIQTWVGEKVSESGCRSKLTYGIIFLSFSLINNIYGSRSLRDSNLSLGVLFFSCVWSVAGQQRQWQQQQQ